MGVSEGRGRRDPASTASPLFCSHFAAKKSAVVRCHPRLSLKTTPTINTNTNFAKVSSCLSINTSPATASKQRQISIPTPTPTMTYRLDRASLPCTENMLGMSLCPTKAPAVCSLCHPKPTEQHPLAVDPAAKRRGWESGGDLLC